MRKRAGENGYTALQQRLQLPFERRQGDDTWAPPLTRLDEQTSPSPPERALCLTSCSAAKPGHYAATLTRVAHRNGITLHFQVNTKECAGASVERLIEAMNAEGIPIRRAIRSVHAFGRVQER